MSTFLTKNLSDHEELVFSLDLSTMKPYSDCFECHRDLATDDKNHHHPLQHCPCGAVRWYFVPDADNSIGTLTNYKPTTIISGPIRHEHEKEHVMTVGANMLTRIHVAVYGQYPDIEGYDVCFGGEGSAGNVLVHATCWEKVGGVGVGVGMGGKKGHRRKDSGVGLVAADEGEGEGEGAYDGDVEDEGVFDLV